MKNYGDELRYRRDRAGLTLRELAQLIDTSPTYVTDFENAKKSNPPEPAAMQRIATALDWPVIDQLAAWGYAVGGKPAQSAKDDLNPFPAGDRRRRIFEKIEWGNPLLLALINDLLDFTNRDRTSETSSLEQSTDDFAAS